MDSFVYYFHSIIPTIVIRWQDTIKNTMVYDNIGNKFEGLKLQASKQSLWWPYMLIISVPPKLPGLSEADLNNKLYI